MINAPIRIYIAGPYTIGNIQSNIENAIDIGNIIFNHGFYPYIPHLTHFWHKRYDRPWGDWIGLDLAFLELCQGLFRLPGQSAGADIEEREAKIRKIPVFYDLVSLLEYKWERGIT